MTKTGVDGFPLFRVGAIYGRGGRYLEKIVDPKLQATSKGSSGMQTEVTNVSVVLEHDQILKDRDAKQMRYGMVPDVEGLRSICRQKVCKKDASESSCVCQLCEANVLGEWNWDFLIPRNKTKDEERFANLPPRRKSIHTKRAASSWMQSTLPANRDMHAVSLKKPPLIRQTPSKKIFGIDLNKRGCPGLDPEAAAVKLMQDVLEVNTDVIDSLTFDSPADIVTNVC
jgi:hypothetical protein